MLPWEDLPAQAPSASESPVELQAEEESPSDEELLDQDDLTAYAYLDNLEPLEAVDAAQDAMPASAPLADLPAATGLAAEWLNLYPQLGLSGMTASIAANSTLVAVDGARWTLHLDPAQSALFNAAQQRRLNEALAARLGQAVQLDIHIIAPTQETPAQAASRARAERQQAAIRAMHADPLVQQMMTLFGASVRDDTIEPLDR